MILAGQFASEEDVQRFYTEAAAAALLDHPGIVPVYEVGEHQGQHFFSMGFVEGTSLAARITTGPLPPREAAGLLKLIAEAIAYAHSKGVIHRALKPANVLLDKQGTPKVTDFGLAKNMESESGLTRTGSVMGTPSYMPPEQAGGANDQVGPRSDVYSLGAMLYCLLTGRPPFQAANPLDTLLQVMTTEPVPPRQLNPQIPKDLETICVKCLQKDASRRYESASALAADLGRYHRGEPIHARSISRSERTWRWCKRNPVVASLLAVSVTLLLVSLVSLRLAKRNLAKQIEQAKEASTALLSYALAEYEAARFSNSTNILTRAWNLRPDDDPIKEPYARVIVDQLTRGGRSWINLPHEGDVLSVAFSPDGIRLATASGQSVNFFDVEQVVPNDLPRFISNFTDASNSSRPWDEEFGRKLIALQSKRSLRYRQSTAIKAVADKNWFVAKFHLPWLIDHEPKNPRWQALLEETNAAQMNAAPTVDAVVPDQPKESIEQTKH